MKIPFILILLGIIPCVYMETCPSYEEIHPCTCKEEETGDIVVICSEKRLNIIRLKFALNSLSSKEDVNLAFRNFELGTVPSNFFYGIIIKKLEISNCILDSLSDDGRGGLYGLEDSLEALSIISSFNEDTVPSKIQFGNLVNLKELDISFNTITELGDNWFQSGPVSLKYLTLSNNGIQKIGRNAFANLINLKRLSLDGNRFGPIQRSMFPGKPIRAIPARLERLELNNNALTELPDDIFSSMPALSSVSLRANGLSKLDQRVWYEIWGQLDVIKLEDNPIHCDGHMNWVFELRLTSAIYGRCYSPREFEGQSLQDLIESRGRFGKNKNKKTTK